MTVRVSDQSVELRASTCVRVISLCASVRIPLTDTLDNHGCILGLVRLDLYTCLGSYSVYPSDPWVNDRYCVGVVLIPYLSAIIPNMPDRGVVRDSDSFIDSYIVPLSCIGLAEQHYYRGVIAMFHIFFANITMHGRSPVSQ